MTAPELTPSHNLIRNTITVLCLGIVAMGCSAEQPHPGSTPTPTATAEQDQSRRARSNTATPTHLGTTKEDDPYHIALSAALKGHKTWDQEQSLFDERDKRPAGLKGRDYRVGEHDWIDKLHGPRCWLNPISGHLELSSDNHVRYYSSTAINNECASKKELAVTPAYVKTQDAQFRSRIKRRHNEIVRVDAALKQVARSALRPYLQKTDEQEVQALNTLLPLEDAKDTTNYVHRQRYRKFMAHLNDIRDGGGICVLPEGSFVAPLGESNFNIVVEPANPNPDETCEPGIIYDSRYVWK